METILFAIFITCFVLIMLVQINWQMNQAELSQTIEFLNRNLTDENRESFVVTRSFGFPDSWATPVKFVIDDRNMKNTFYRIALKNYDEKQRLAHRSTWIISSIMALTVVILVNYYPEAVRDFFMRLTNLN